MQYVSWKNIVKDVTQRTQRIHSGHSGYFKV